MTSVGIFLNHSAQCWSGHRLWNNLSSNPIYNIHFHEVRGFNTRDNPKTAEENEAIGFKQYHLSNGNGIKMYHQDENNGINQYPLNDANDIKLYHLNKSNQDDSSGEEQSNQNNANDSKQYHLNKDDGIGQYQLENTRSINQYLLNNANSLKQYHLNNANGINQYNMKNANSIKQYNLNTANGIKQYHMKNGKSVKQFHLNNANVIKQNHLTNANSMPQNQNYAISSSQSPVKSSKSRFYFGEKKNDERRRVQVSSPLISQHTKTESSAASEWPRRDDYERGFQQRHSSSQYRSDGESSLFDVSQLNDVGTKRCRTTYPIHSPYNYKYRVQDSFYGTYFMAEASKE